MAFPMPCARCGRPNVFVMHRPPEAYPNARAFCPPCVLAMPGGQHVYIEAEYNHHSMASAKKGK